MEISYKGFVARILYSADIGTFYGEILNAELLMVFQASTLQGCREAMHFTVDEYLSRGQVSILDKKTLDKETLDKEAIT